MAKNLTKDDTRDTRCFYVYRHLRGEDGSGEPFYIGLGKHRPNANCPSLQYTRANAKGKDRSPFWNNIVNKYGHTVEIVLDNLTKEEALAKEVELIALYGRITEGGILCNLTPGGEGVCDISPSKELRDRYSKLNTKTADDHIIESVFPEPNTGCWLWAGGTDSRGRAILHSGKKTYQAHRFFLEHFKEVKLTKRDCVTRTCDCGVCVNPDHMVIQTIHEVKQRYRDKKLQTPLEFAKAEDSKISNETKHHILYVIERMNFTDDQLAKLFFVPKYTVANIRRRLSERRIALNG